MKETKEIVKEALYEFYSGLVVGLVVGFFVNGLGVIIFYLITH